MISIERKSIAISFQHGLLKLSLAVFGGKAAFQIREQIQIDKAATDFLAMLSRIVSETGYTARFHFIPVYETCVRRSAARVPKSRGPEQYCQ